MDKTKKMILRVFIAWILLLSIGTVKAHDIGKLDFCDIEYEYKPGKDSITLYFNLYDISSEKKINNLSDSEFNDITKSLNIQEDYNVINGGKFEIVKSVQQIPSEYTFSVLVDLSIPKSGKELIYDAVSKLVESAPDSCVYLSFLGDSVTSSVLVTKNNYKELKKEFDTEAHNKYFYSGLYSKLIEFSDVKDSLESKIKTEENYKKNDAIAAKAKKYRDRNILFVFIEGDNYPSDESERSMTYNTFDNYYEKMDTSKVAPKIYALYYAKNGNNDVGNLLRAICNPRDGKDQEISNLKGMYSPADNIDSVINKFKEVVNELKYDYSFKYKVNESKNYTGEVKFYCLNKGKNNTDAIGYRRMSVGSPERPWPIREENTSGIALKYLYALLVSLLAIAFVFVVTKVIIPYVRSKSFAINYFKKYVPEANVSRRVCHYCRQEIQPGQSVVTRCKHIMHVSCWKQNGYKCVEYGQNCKTGIQSHIEWNEVFSISSLKDCYQAISGIIAGFISWCLYELLDTDLFNSISESIVKLCYDNQDGTSNLLIECVNKTSSFLTIGLLLGFFISLIFRYNDEYKNKDFKVWTKILGLSVLTGMIGLIAFACGAILLYFLLSVIKTASIPWYCSLPAYILFSISVSLALSIKSTIPQKSALLGGLSSSLIGFIVLYYSSQFNESQAWMNMLLNFVIYGGGLGASLVTIRILAEKYFLVIQNGVRAGQRIPIHKWMNATGGGNTVTIGMGSDCEIQMNWEKSNKLSDEHVQLYIDYDKQLPMLNPLAAGVIFNARVELPIEKPVILSNGDNFKVGDTIFLYQETE